MGTNYDINPMFRGRPMREDICNVLRERIINIYYKPGDPLDEKKLAEEFGSSRTPIREALISLSEENLITIIPRSSARVSDINRLDFQKFIALRLILECGVSELAVQNITEEEIQDLERLNKKIHINNSEDISELIDHDMEFYCIIRKAFHN